MEKLTIKSLKEMEAGSIIDTGLVLDSAEGINVDNTGKMLRWVACRGEIHDWCIYVHFADKDEKFVRESGNKLRGVPNIRKLVDCDDEALDMYRR